MCPSTATSPSLTARSWVGLCVLARGCPTGSLRTQAVTCACMQQPGSDWARRCRQAGSQACPPIIAREQGALAQLAQPIGVHVAKLLTRGACPTSMKDPSHQRFQVLTSVGVRISPVHEPSHALLAGLVLQVGPPGSEHAEHQLAVRGLRLLHILGPESHLGTLYRAGARV